jgi:hypothetical protein
MQVFLLSLILFTLSLPGCFCSQQPIPKIEADADALKALTRFCKTHKCNVSDFKVTDAREKVAVGGSNEYLAWMYDYRGRDVNGVDYTVRIMIDYCGGTEISYLDLNSIEQ